MDYLEQNSLLNINNADYFLGDILPIYKIDQKTTNRGMIAISTGGIKSNVNFIWLAMSRSRILWPEYDPKIKDPKPLCKSLDGISPHAGVTIRNNPCQECLDSQWLNGRPSLCAEVYNLLCWDIEDQAPFIFGVKRTGIKALRILKAQLKHGASKFAHPGLPAHCCVKIQLIGKAESSYFVPDFTILSQNNQEESTFYHKLAIKYTQTLEPIDPEDLNGNH